MRQFLTFLAIIAVSAAVAHYTPPRNNSPVSAATESESTLARVIRTKTLRCGYVDYEPANFRDAKTGAMKGILTDVAEAMAKKLDVKVEWVLAGGWASFFTDLKMNKFDAFCGAAWAIQTPEMVDLAATTPIYFSAISAWVAADDTRFTSNLDNVNDPAITIAATDGSFPMLIAQSDYPKAKVLSLPETASYTMNLVNVADHKADIGFLEQYIGNQYSLANPGKVKNITPAKPVHISPNVFEVRKQDADLLSAMEMALNVLHYNGEIDAIIRKYEPVPNTFLRRASAYEMAR